MTFSIPKPSNFDFSLSLWFLDRGFDDCMHQVTGNKVRKLIWLEEKPLLFEVKADGNELLVNVLNGTINDTGSLIVYIKEWLDIDRDLKPFYSLLKKDRDLWPLLNYPGFHIVGIPDLFEALCWCILGQQINLEFAYRLKRRLVEKYGTTFSYEGQNYFLFPGADVLAGVPVEDLRAMQITNRKVEYITGVAKLFANGQLSKQSLLSLKDEHLMRETLMKVRGIGEWTANYALMKSCRAMNCVPYGDSGINNALFKFKSIPKRDNRELVEAFFDQYQNWKSYLVYYCWISLREKPS